MFHLFSPDYLFYLRITIFKFSWFWVTIKFQNWIFPLVFVLFRAHFVRFLGVVSSIIATARVRFSISRPRLLIRLRAEQSCSCFPNSASIRSQKLKWRFRTSLFAIAKPWRETEFRFANTVGIGTQVLWFEFANFGFYFGVLPIWFPGFTFEFLVFQNCFSFILLSPLSGAPSFIFLISNAKVYPHCLQPHCSIFWEFRIQLLFFNFTQIWKV